MAEWDVAIELTWRGLGTMTAEQVQQRVRDHLLGARDIRNLRVEVTPAKLELERGSGPGD